jgi:hypothetical protein
MPAVTICVVTDDMGQRGTRRTSRLRSLGIVIGVAIIVSFLAASLVGLWQFAHHDRLELIDDPQVVSTTESACATMTQAVRRAAAPPAGTNAANARAIQLQNDAVAAMIRAVRLLGPDRLDNDYPTSRWLTDWQTLIDERARYARDLAGNRPTTFVIPTVEGRPITERMNDVGITCAVPVELTNLR